jgi:hypothetical protein
VILSINCVRCSQGHYRKYVETLKKICREHFRHCAIICFLFALLLCVFMWYKYLKIDKNKITVKHVKLIEMFIVKLLIMYSMHAPKDIF